MKDLKSEIKPLNSISPAAHTATVTGASVDLQGFNAACAVVSAGTVTDGTHTPKLQESNDNITFTDVAVGDLHGAFIAVTTGSIQKVGYKGVQRYLRLVSTVAGATVGGQYIGQIILGEAENEPLI